MANKLKGGGEIIKEQKEDHIKKLKILSKKNYKAKINLLIVF